MKNTQLTLYAFLALSITVLPAACNLPDSDAAGTPAKPTATAPKKEEPLEPQKKWKWSQLTAKQSHSIVRLVGRPADISAVCDGESELISTCCLYQNSPVLDTEQSRTLPGEVLHRR